MLHSMVLSLAALTVLSAGGLVVDREGFGIARATVVFHDAAGDVAKTTTDENGRFTVALPRTPTTWAAGAAGYRTAHLHFSDPTRLIATLQLAEPAFSEPVGSDDLGVLPYQDVGYALALTPYQVLIGGSQVGVGDRGLGGSANADFDNGVSVDAPAHYLSFVGVTSASSSYGFSQSAAGRFDLGFDSANRAGGTIGAGTLRLAGVQSQVGDAYAGFGSSAGDGVSQTLANVVARTKIGKSKLLFTAGNWTFDDATGSHEALEAERTAKLRLQVPVGDSILRFEAETKSKHKTSIADYLEDESASSLKALFRHTGGILTSEYGVEQDLDMGTRDYVDSHTKHFQGDVHGRSLSTTQQITLGRFSATGTLGTYALTAQGSTKASPGPNPQAAAAGTASLAAQWAFGDDLQLQVASSANEDSATDSIYFGDPIPALIVDVSHVDEATLSYRRSSGFVASATLVGERYISYLGTTTLYGRGASIDWPIGDRWRVRAWTFGLNDQSPAIPAGTLGPSRGRDVGWLTYYASPRVRFDAIYRRETDPIELGRYLDGDAAFVLNQNATLIVTRERHAAFSSFGLSLRFGSGSTK
ncbi:MAG TPA: carboxypeptidase-like regulatory domain-containing protein [Candidatus Baltobacteraceae bacterium]